MSERTGAPLRIVMVAMEMVPYVKVGGLGDVVGALSVALARRGHEVTVLLPGLPVFQDPASGLRLVEHPSLDVPFGGRPWPVRTSRVLDAPGDVRVVVLHDPAFAHRQGVYADPATGHEYPGSADAYARFCRGALAYLLRVDLAPDILHVHDFQAALVPALLRRTPVSARFFAKTRVVLTIHNLGYQGIYDPAVLTRAGFPAGSFHPGSPLEYWGQTNFLKAGILDAERLTTVSPRYAREILAGPEYGHGLEGVLGTRVADLTGILNGIDVEHWNPATDPHLAAPYDARRLDGKQRNRQALAARVGLSGSRMVAGMVTRLVDQKGIDLVSAGAATLLDHGVDLVVLGSGRKDYEQFFGDLSQRSPGRVSFDRSFNEPLAHLIEAGADAFLMPSRYEPCGLNQMISQRYGTVPVVRRTGGLADTVTSMEDDPTNGTGFVFDAYTADAFVGAVERAHAAWANRGRWEAIQRRGMERDFSWAPAAASYEALFRNAVAGPPRQAVS